MWTLWPGRDLPVKRPGRLVNGCTHSAARRTPVCPASTSVHTASPDRATRIPLPSGVLPGQFACTRHRLIEQCAFHLRERARMSPLVIMRLLRV